jgi:hypothetical protein
MDETSAKKVLKEVRDILYKENIEFWINFGTLLGAVREGSFIKHDNDIEINAWENKVNQNQLRKICRELCYRGFKVYYSPLIEAVSIQKENIPIAFSLYSLRGDKAVRPHEGLMDSKKLTAAKLSLWFSELFSREREGKINRETLSNLKCITMFSVISLLGMFPKKIRRNIAIRFREFSIQKARSEYGTTRIPAKYFLRLDELEFYGDVYKIPSNTLDYLELSYGPQWRTPIKGWHHYYADISGGEPVTCNELWDYRGIG